MGNASIAVPMPAIPPSVAAANAVTATATASQRLRSSNYDLAFNHWHLLDWIDPGWFGRYSTR